ncbi:MAG: acyl-CoA thioesterase, partial [Candidatus Omnitrophica bacterium]|nr:acyl-CoA thioesterase [Candidatus Omnitrophota bacterium]
LVWFEVARTEFLKSLGISYREIEENEGLGLMVVESRCKYRSPVTYDDTITVETWVSEVKRSSLAFDYKITLKDTLVAEGRTYHVFVNKKRKPVKIPQGFLEIIQPIS